jgi:CRISPR/Cas system Type II protein with McrA/HNH and RuvC-like nuclease domain
MGNKFEEIKNKSERLKENSFRDFWTEVVECSALMKQLDPIQRRPWIAHVICEMYEEQAGKCALTGHPLDGSFEVDHIVPVSYAGGNERTNLRLVSLSANRSRGNRGVDPHDLLRYLEDRYQNR